MLLLVGFVCFILGYAAGTIRRAGVLLTQLENKQEQFRNLQERTRVLEVKIDNHLNNGAGK